MYNQQPPQHQEQKLKLSQQQQQPPIQRQPPIVVEAVTPGSDLGLLGPAIRSVGGGVSGSGSGPNSVPPTPVHRQPDPANRDNLDALIALFGPMFKFADGEEEIEKILRKPNANSLEELKSVVDKHRHKGSCICKVCGTVCGSILCCSWVNRCAVIEPQTLGIIMHSGYPELVGPGTYCLPSCRQRFKEKVPQSRPYIKLHNMHIIQVHKGKIGLAMHNGEPIFLDYGRHCIFDGLLTFDEHLRDRTDAVIQHGHINIINIRRGSIGYGLTLDSPEPVILGEGFHLIKSKYFQFMGIIDLSRPVIDIGTMKLVRVETGDVGVAYMSGKLAILEPGLHLLIPPNRFHGFLCTQQTVLSLPEAVHESGDYVPLKVKADVFYRIVDPLLAVTTVDDIERTIGETAAATLAGIIRSSTLQDIAKSSKATHGDEEQADELTSFYAFVHDHFISELHDDCLHKWGIELLNIRIESMNINNPTLANQISQQSLIYAQTQAQLANLEADRHIKETEAIRDANVAIQGADAERRSKELEAEAAAQTILVEARAVASGSIKEAEGEGRATTIKAEADAAAIIRAAESEKKRLGMEGEGHELFFKELQRNEFGPKFAKLELEKQLLEGTERIYLANCIPTVFPSTGLVERVPVPDASTSEFASKDKPGHH